jgi:hypothetical protein
LILEDASRAAVQIAEDYSDGTASLEELARIRRLAGDTLLNIGLQLSQSSWQSTAAEAAFLATLPDVPEFDPHCVYTGPAQESCPYSASTAAGHQVSGDWRNPSLRQAYFREAKAQTLLLRDIFFNPFRPPPILDPAWLRWRDGTIPRLAQQMYDARDFASMPILADALEEAGCTSGDILEHCRGPGPHVRGCWVVDLVLGKVLFIRVAGKIT